MKIDELVILSEYKVPQVLKTGKLQQIRRSIQKQMDLETKDLYVFRDLAEGSDIIRFTFQTSFIDAKHMADELIEAAQAAFKENDVTAELEGVEHHKTKDRWNDTQVSVLFKISY